MSSYRTPFDCGLGYIVKYSDHSRNEVREEVDFPQTREEDEEPRFNVNYYVNGVLTYTISTLRPSQVYDTCICNEMTDASSVNRWHVMTRQAAITRMLHTNLNESFTLCFQETVKDLDTEMIIITGAVPDVKYD
jgi:hypothetical protein